MWASSTVELARHLSNESIALCLRHVSSLSASNDDAPAWLAMLRPPLARPFDFLTSKAVPCKSEKPVNRVFCEGFLGRALICATHRRRVGEFADDTISNYNLSWQSDGGAACGRKLNF